MTQSRCWFFNGIRLAIALFMMLLPGSVIGLETRRTVEVTRDLFVSYPSNWAPAKEQYHNAFNLVTPPDAPAPDAIKAVINITTETRQDHTQVIQQLREMASGLPNVPRFLTIGGWPAFQSRGLVPVHTRRQQEEKEGLPLDSQGRRLIRWATTVVATDNVLLRIEATLAPRADARLLEQVDAIGRRVRFVRAGDPAISERELRKLRKDLRRASPRVLRQTQTAVRSRQLATAMPGAAAVLAGPGPGEFEIAASSNGQNVVIAGNSPIVFSGNFGQTFAPAQPIQNNCAAGGDLSVAWSPNGGPNGTFYLSYLKDTNCRGPNPNAIGIATSTNNGQTFVVGNNAVLGAVDQPHIAVDPRPSGNDQIYVVYKSEGGPLGTEQAAMVCSPNSGQTWSAPVAVGAMGDNYPRITVGQDGIVYVISRGVMNGNVRILPFAACANNPNLMPGSSWFVAVVQDDAMCPVPGLDRCNDGNTLQSWMVAVDDTNPNHVYAAYALPSGANNTAIFVQDFMKASPAGAPGSTGGPVRIDAGTATQRFMPWVCSIGGAAFVSWYDRGATIGAPRNDLTNYVLGSALGQGSSLRPGPLVNLSVNPDPQCASGVGCPNNPNALGCAVPPPPGGGCPKYGDYNGNACAAGRVYTAWASATAPPGLPPVAQITNFFAFTQAVPSTLTVNKVVVPGNDPGRFDLLVDGTVQLAGAQNNGTVGPILLQLGTHTVSENPSAGTVGSEYATRFQGACAPSGMVTLAPGDTKTCTVVNFHGSGAFLTVQKSLVPASDPGRFDISVDGALLLPSAGNGDTTGAIPLPPGTHSVTEEVDSNTDACDYLTSFQGACARRGTVTLAPGDNKTCTIINRHRTHTCPPGFHWCGCDEGCQRFCF